MATAKRKQSGFITLKVSQDEADLIRSVFGDLYAEPYSIMSTQNRARSVVTDIFLGLEDVTESRSYKLFLGQGGLDQDRIPF